MSIRVEVDPRISKLARQLNFSVKTINGCCFFGPTIGDETVPPTGTGISVGCIPEDFYEDEIYEHFIKYGTIHRIKTRLNRDSTNKAVCFIEYKEASSALVAIRIGGSSKLRKNEKPLHVTASTDILALETGEEDQASLNSSNQLERNDDNSSGRDNLWFHETTITNPAPSPESPNALKETERTSGPESQERLTQIEDMIDPLTM